MSLAAQVLEKLFENRYNFVAPDSGPHNLPYTCSFHWFRAPNGQLIGVDVVRSDDLGKNSIPLGGSACLELSGVKTGPHSLLLRPTTTAVANATYVSDNGVRMEVGEVILDFRGGDYPALLES